MVDGILVDGPTWRKVSRCPVAGPLIWKGSAEISSRENMRWIYWWARKRRRREVERTLRVGLLLREKWTAAYWCTFTDVNMLSWHHVLPLRSHDAAVRFYWTLRASVSAFHQCLKQPPPPFTPNIQTNPIAGVWKQAARHESFRVLICTEPVTLNHSQLLQ